MKKKTLLFLFASTIILVGIISCDTSNKVNNQDNMTGITGANQQASKAKMKTMSATSSGGSSTFSMEITPTGSNLDTKAKSPGGSNHIVINGETSDRLNVTGNLQITTGSASSSSDMLKVSPKYRTYHNIPESISYNGSSSLSYTLNGTSYSGTLTSDQITILDDLQQKLDEVRDYGNEDPPPPCLSANQKNDIEPQRCEEQNTITTQVTSGQSLKKMTDQQVKQWLLEQGYNKVKILRNREYQVTKIYSEEEFGRNMSITSVFDAKSGKMKQEYSVSKDGKTITQQSPIQ